VAPLKARAGRPRQRAVDAYRATCSTLGAPCWLCGYAIDYHLERHRHPLRFTVDEYHPLSLGGDPLDPANYRPAHAVCNSSRGNRPPTDEVRRACQATYHRHSAARTHSRTW
jgi:5-methylcytosine-specific restriction endonuclease McrA